MHSPATAADEYNTLSASSGPVLPWRVIVYPVCGVVPKEWEDMLRIGSVPFRVPSHRERIVMFYDTYAAAEDAAQRVMADGATTAVVERSGARETGEDEVVVCNAIPHDAQEHYAAAGLMPWRRTRGGRLQVLMERDVDGWGWLGGKRQGRELAIQTAEREFYEETKGVVIPMRILQRLFKCHRGPSYAAVTQTQPDSAVLWFPTCKYLLFALPAEGLLWEQDLRCCRDTVAWKDVQTLDSPGVGVRPYILRQQRFMRWLQNPGSLRAAATHIKECRGRVRRATRRGRAPLPSPPPHAPRQPTDCTADDHPCAATAPRVRSVVCVPSLGGAPAGEGVVGASVGSDALPA